MKDYYWMVEAKKMAILGWKTEWGIKLEAKLSAILESFLITDLNLACWTICSL